MSYYRMARKGLEFEAIERFQIAYAAKHYTNTTGLVEVIDRVIAKFDHMTSEETDVEEIAEERAELVRTLRDTVRAYMKPGNSLSRGLVRIADLLDHHLETSVPDGRRLIGTIHSGPVMD